MTARWYVVQVENNKADSAAEFIKQLEFDVFAPVIRKLARRLNKVTEIEVPLFGVYIFARFDAERDPWGHLRHSKGQRAGIVCVLCSMAYPEGEPPLPRPSPVPDRAIELVRAYVPLPQPTHNQYRFHPGEPCVVTKAGHHQTGVFDSYCGNRQFVRMWVFGSERLVEIALAEIEPMNLDNGPVPATNCRR